MDSQIFEVKANGEARDVQREDLRDAEEEEDYKSQPQTGDGASPGKIFVGGLARETTSVQFIKHFGKYGEIIDSVIMKDRTTGQPRGFGFITYADPSVVDEVIQDTHVINGKQVEIKRTIPKGAAGSKDFKTKKIFVGGIPATVNEDEFRDFFSQFGEVKEHQVMRDHSTGRSRGFGFVTFESEQSVDDLLVKGKKLDFAGVQVEIKKAEPKKPNAPPPPSKRYNDSRPGFGGGYKDSYGAYGGSSYGGRDFGSSGSFRSAGAYSGRSSAYGGGGGGGYGGSEFGGYGVYGGMGGFGAHRGEPSVYSGRYGGAFNRGFDLGGAYGGSGEDYGPYVGGGSGGAASGGGGGYGNNYDTGMGSGYVGGGSAGSFYGSRGGYSGAGNSRYHPYGR